MAEVVGKILKMTEEECKVSVVTFFDNVARGLGLEPDEVQSYDCTKIEISSDIQSAIFDYYKQDGYEPDSLGRIWVCYGPKVNDTLEERTVVVQKGFI